MHTIVPTCVAFLDFSALRPAMCSGLPIRPFIALSVLLIESSKSLVIEFRKEFEWRWSQRERERERERERVCVCVCLYMYLSLSFLSLSLSLSLSFLFSLFLSVAAFYRTRFHPEEKLIADADVVVPHGSHAEKTSQLAQPYSLRHHFG